MIKRNRVADRYIAVLRQQVEITAEQHAKFVETAQLDAAVQPGEAWFCEEVWSGAFTFDTDDGFLHPGDFYEGDKEQPAIYIRDAATRLMGEAAIKAAAEDK